MFGILGMMSDKTDSTEVCIDTDGSCLVEQGGEVYVKDPWEGKLHNAHSDYTTPSGVRVVEAVYAGNFDGLFEDESRVVLVVVRPA